MLEQDYSIPSPTLSPFTVNLMEEEYVDEINSEHERISLSLNELLADNDTDSTRNNEIKKNILIKIFEALLLFFPLKSDSTTTFSTSTANTSNYEEQEKIILNEPPSLFMIKTLFIKIYKEKEYRKNVEINDFNEFGCTFGQKLWNSRLDINFKKSAIESPQTIQEYYNAFPEFLKNFFSGMTIKVVTFIASMLLSLAFPHLKVWLPQVLASLSHMP
ncbi:22334_t:CDS:2 [Rhizophagus irregularis]|nr:22334_t:CDS:2 [Rhizophagus irregularis]